MLRSLFWKPYSRLIVVGDNANWSIDEEAKQLIRSAKALGIKVLRVRKIRTNIPQAIHFSSQFSLLDGAVERRKNRLSLDYFHGKPEHGETYRKCLELIGQHNENIYRVRVSTREMEAVIKATGISPEKIVRIPIGIDLGLFPPQTPENKERARRSLNIPAEAFVIGSFQKDGVGWSEGNEPKLIKGPDTFLQVIASLKDQIPHLHVLLSGPARGYVKNGLQEMGVLFTHRYVEQYQDISELYNALDLYLITSREEGGPKAALESMAKGVPLVTTAVGQCADLVATGENAMMTPIDDVEELTQACLAIRQDLALQKKLIEGGFKTAEANSFKAQLPLWAKYFDQLIQK